MNDDIDLMELIDFDEQHLDRTDEFFDRHFNAASLVEMNPFGSRRNLCKFLGIGESTLSGWLKEGHVPRAAKNASCLLVVHRRLSEEIRRLRSELDELRDKDLKVVHAGDHYQICEFDEDEDGEVTGRVVADRIGTIEDARILASGHRGLRLAGETDPVFDYVYDRIGYDMPEDDVVAEFWKSVKEIDKRLVAHALFLTDHEGWKKRFGKKALSARLEEHLGNPPSSGTSHPKDDKETDHD